MNDTLPFDRDRARAAERRALWLACQFAWLTLLTFWIIASLSIDTEFARAGRDGPPFFAWVTEGSSVIMTALMVPGMMWLGLRVPLEPGRWLSSLPWHLLGFLAYTSLHVLGMVLIREGVWTFGYGSQYEFLGDAPWREIIYEARKDLGTYAGYQIIMAVALALQMRRLEVEAARAEARNSHRVTLKCGGRTLRIAAREFRAAQAAGNYVEIRLAGGEHLARSTLTELERQLTDAGIDVVRVHRSWLVNRDSITEIAPTGEGDVAITLDTGSQIPGSRRYRARLDAA
jgi:LytTr DNA-binding domain-containing protein